MALSDYFKGPQYKERAEFLSTQLIESQQRCERTLADLNQLQAEHSGLKELAAKFGAMEAAEVQHELEVRRAALREAQASVIKARTGLVPVSWTPT